MNTHVLSEQGRFPRKLRHRIQIIKYYLRLDKHPEKEFITQILY